MKKNEILLWIAAWLALGTLGAVWLSKSELDTLRRKFEADSRIAHRLLTQRAVQHDTILATLAAGASADDVQCAADARNQITRMYPQVVTVLCDGMQQAWAGVLSSTAASGFADGRYWLVQDETHVHTMENRRKQADSAPGTGLSRSRSPGARRWALQVDILNMIPHGEWPLTPMRVELHNGSRHLVLQQGPMPAGGWEFHFSKQLASDSQPFTLVTRQHVGWSGLPWMAMSVWMAASGMALAIGIAWRLQWVGRHRAERLLRLRKVERLNTLGELAAGMAHELNQPLTAILANCQAARRLLGAGQPDIGKARDALAHAVEQAKRTAQVIARLRAAIAQPNPAGRMRTLSLNDAVNNALHLLAPEFRQRQVALAQSACHPPAMVSADPVELDQILHNLLMNALQALEQVAPGEREIRIGVERRGRKSLLRIADSGPGIPNAALARVFEPFFTTRENGLGLGLSLCETLAGGMGGSISAGNRPSRGAEFLLTLPQSAT
jgi:signal transduction histidine kinase